MIWEKGMIAGIKHIHISHPLMKEKILKSPMATPKSPMAE